MFDKLADAAMLFKAKIKKDELQPLLIEATSEDNWQTPTPVLHQIANAAYAHDDWKRIQEFIMDKLNGKKWKKVLKSLSLIEFLLKNGPTAIQSDIRGELYMLRGFQTFSCIVDGVDRSQAIRQKAKTVVELLVNQQLLDQQRAKASNIKEKMGLSSNYSNAWNEQSSSKQTGGSSYQGMGSDSTNDYKPSSRKTIQDDSYTNKLKQGFNQFTGAIKTTYNKVNFNDLGGYIKEKVTVNEDALAQRNSLLNEDQPGFVKKNSIEDSKNNTQYKPPATKLFAGLNVKKGNTNGSSSPTIKSQIKQTTQKSTQPNKQTTTSTINSKPVITPKPVKQSQQIDIFSFDNDDTPASNGTHTQNKSPQIDIFAEFEKPVPKNNPTPIPTPALKQPTPTTQNPFGQFDMFSVSNPAQKQNIQPVAKGLTPQQKTISPPAAKQEFSLYSKEESNLIDFDFEDKNPVKQPAQQPIPPQQQVPLNFNPQMMGYPNQYAGYGHIPNYSYAPPSQQPPQPPQMVIPANQYEQFQQFLLFQQQQQQAAVKGKY